MKSTNGMGDIVDKIRPNKKIVLSVLGVLVVLVIAAGAGAGLHLLQDNKAGDDDRTAFQGRTLPEKVDEVQNMRLSGDIDGSIEKIDQALEDTNISASEKYQLYIQRGNAYYDKKDLPAAIDAYVKAEDVKETYEIVSLLATMYEEAGNNPKAVEYYQRSIPLIPETPMRNQYRTDAEAKIQQLGGQN